MSRYLLDTSALLTLRDDGKGADQVADLLYKAEHDEIQCYSCFMTLMELFYRAGIIDLVRAETTIILFVLPRLFRVVLKK